MSKAITIFVENDVTIKRYYEFEVSAENLEEAIEHWEHGEGVLYDVRDAYLVDETNATLRLKKTIDTFNLGQIEEDPTLEDRLAKKFTKLMLKGIDD